MGLGFKVGFDVLDRLLRQVPLHDAYCSANPLGGSTYLENGIIVVWGTTGC